MECYFIEGVAEEVEPALSLVEDFREEDEVGTVNRSGFDVHSAQFDALGVHVFGLWVASGVLPRMCWIVENRSMLLARVNSLMAINYQIYRINLVDTSCRIVASIRHTSSGGNSRAESGMFQVMWVKFRVISFIYNNGNN